MSAGPPPSPASPSAVDPAASTSSSSSSSSSSRLILASASPRRRQLLAQLGIDLQVRPAEVDERTRAGEAPEAYVARLAAEKAGAVAAGHPGRVVLAADTAVVLDGRIFGKPSDRAEARAMLLALFGREHAVLTGVHALGPGGAHADLVTTRVRFRGATAAEADWYVATGEPMDKAGAYGIQDRGGMFVAALEGSYSNVVGLPLAETLALLARAGLRLPWDC